MSLNTVRSIVLSLLRTLAQSACALSARSEAENAELRQHSTSLEAQLAEATAELRRMRDRRQAEWAHIAHTINNVLAGAQAAFDDVMLDVAELGVPAERCAGAERRVIASLRVISNMIDDLHTVALLDRAELRLERSPTDLAALITSAVDQFEVQAQQYGCQIRVTVDADLPHVMADPWRIERALANLIDNAGKSTRQVRGRERVVQVTARAAGVGVMITIADTGSGMDAVALADANQPLVSLATAHGEGIMGNGIYLSRSAVEQPGGTLTFASAGLDHGTTVTVWLPEEPPEPGAAA